MKGGVGKTTLAVNVAYALAYFYGKQTLLVDVDPQFNATQYLIRPKEYMEYIEDDGHLTVFDIFRGAPLKMPTTVGQGRKEVRPAPTLKNTTIPIYDEGGKLELIPSALDLMTLESSERGTENMLSHFLHSVGKAYDFIVLDCPPTTSFFTISAYIASDAFLIPVIPDYLSSVGLSLIDTAIAYYEHRFSKSVMLLGVVFNAVNSYYTLDRDVMKRVRDSGRPVFDNYLRRSTSIAKAVRAHLPIFLYPESKEKHGSDIRKITKELMDKID
jgi:chromosome partitioning protein